jgi:hypothetical protein
MAPKPTMSNPLNTNAIHQRILFKLTMLISFSWAGHKRHSLVRFSGIGRKPFWNVCVFQTQTSLVSHAHHHPNPFFLNGRKSLSTGLVRKRRDLHSRVPARRQPSQVTFEIPQVTNVPQ